MCTRELDDRTVQFGTTGYTNNSVFVLYDRDSDSIWHPMSDDTLDAVAGGRQGESVSFVAKPDPQPLGDWIAAHPDTTVLLPSQQDADWLHGMRTRPFLGVQLEDGEAGLVILEVVPDSGAADAGLAAGDVFISLAGEPVRDRSDLQAVMSGHAIGDVVRIVVDRAGEEFTCEATLRARSGN